MEYSLRLELSICWRSMSNTPHDFEVLRLSRRTRLLQDDAVLSEILHHPGPTHRFIDLLAACVSTLAPGPRVLMLGFAGGGLIAPLRALGCRHPVLGLDLSSAGHDLFLEHCGEWAGEVQLEVAEAVAWLRAHRGRHDLILDDLSIPSPEGVTKPEVSLGVVPELMRRRLRPGGVGVLNLLPMPRRPWSRLLAQVTAPFPCALEIVSAEYWNRAILVGDALPSAAAVSRRLRRNLRSVRSQMSDRFRVRALRHGERTAEAG